MIIKNLSGEFRAGTSTAIIGPSGSGKSTFIRVFAGLVPVKTWSSSINIDLINRESNLISQTPFLFKGTLRENLLYGNPRQDMTDDLIYEKLDQVCIADEIRRSAKGLEDQFDPISPSLSGGQIQRMVVARALLRQGKICLFDEATSAVDQKTELEMIESMIADCHRHQRSLLFVTHRVQFLNKFDQVWFFENGDIRFKGKHEALLKNPRYKKFCDDA